MKNGYNNEVCVPHLWYKHSFREKNNTEQHFATVHSNFALLWGASYRRTENHLQDSDLFSLNRQNPSAAMEVSYKAGALLNKAQEALH